MTWKNKGTFALFKQNEVHRMMSCDEKKKKNKQINIPLIRVKRIRFFFEFFSFKKKKKFIYSRSQFFCPRKIEKIKNTIRIIIC